MENWPIQIETIETDKITSDEVLLIEHEAHVSVDYLTEFGGQSMLSRS